MSTSGEVVWLGFDLIESERDFSTPLLGAETAEDRPHRSAKDG